MTYSERDEKLKELIDIEFLNKLLEIGKLYGWSGDYHEIGEFIINLHKYKNIDISDNDIEPYELTD